MSPRYLIAPLMALTCFGACSTTAADTKAEGDRARLAAGAAAAVADREAVAATDGSLGGQAPMSPERQQAEATFREIWQTKAFQARLASAYLRGGEVDPPMTIREGEFRQEVLNLISDDEVDKAMSRLRSLQDDKQAVWDFMLGNLLLGKERFEEAAGEYLKATAKYPTYRRAWQMLGFAQMRAGRFPAAADAFVQVIALGGGDAQTYGFLGLMHAQAGDYVAAESAFRMVMMMDPGDERWKRLLADSMGRQGRHADSASMIGMLLKRSPNDPQLYLMQAYAFAQMGETEKAAANLEIVDRLGGSNYQSLSTLGTIYFNDELYELAVDAYLRATRAEDRGRHGALLEIANRLAARSAYDDARRLVEGLETAYASELSQEDRLEMMKLRARLAVAVGATEQQVALLQKIVDENPRDADALIQLARYWQDHGEVEKAIHRYEQAARNEKFAAEAKVLHGQLLANEQRYAEAAPLLKAALDLKPRDDVKQLLEFVERAARTATSSKK